MLLRGAPPPFRDALDRLLALTVIFVGGKGGVGKTTVAAALGAAAAARGRTPLVVSTDPAHSLGDVFDRSIGASEQALGERLYGLEIDAALEAERHIAVVKQQMKDLVHPRMYDEVDRQLDLARYAPGTEESALLERMATLMGEAGNGRFDLVIFDTAPTGHTLRLLQLPEIMAAWTEGLLRHEERSSRLGAIVKRLGGPASRGDEQSLLGTPDDREDARTRRIREVLLARQRKLGRARDMLHDAGTSGFLMVLNPDKLSILESQKALASLAHARIRVSAIVVNRVLPEEGGAFLEARRRQEAVYLEEIDRAFHDVPRGRLPLLPGDVRGLDALRKVGELLVGRA